MDVYPTLTYRDVRLALGWIEHAFGLEPRVFAAPGADTIDHAALMHGDGMVLVESERPAELHGSHTGTGWVYVAVDDIDSCDRRAIEAGAEVLNEPHGAADSAQRGFSARDLEGNLWTFGTMRPRR